MPDHEGANRVLGASHVPGKSIYLVGTFDIGVTVLSQQIRALNLVWALTEAGRITARAAGEEETSNGSNFKIAIIGAGFAGLSVAAGLLRKGVRGEITIFEQRDTLLPLQHGSDTRWLHPRIYNWPAEGSETNAAMLPVLNWTAARASDVVVQVLADWKDLIDPLTLKPVLYCNTRHLQVYEVSSKESKLQLEWIGENRNPSDGRTDGNNLAPMVGETETFDLVIVAVGFGLERENTLSYWRNDTIGQPNLEQPRLTYLVSGQGDGAMIDLLRLRISHYRQDRILRELFGETRQLVSAVETIYKRYHVSRTPGIFDAFERLRSQCHEDFSKVHESLSKRLRRDTDVIIHLKVRQLSDLLESSNRISFQNKLLVYLLYKCGGFIPSNTPEYKLTRRHSIPKERIVRRHGPARDEQLRDLLSESLFQAIKSRHDSASPSAFEQTDQQAWPGGYFGYTGLASDAERGGVSESITLGWRKEYLPAPTVLLAAAFCSSLAGMLRRNHVNDKRLRVTLHRAVTFGKEELLQQCCEYFGVDPSPPALSTAARTFPASNATIGLAYETRRIVRSLRGVSPQDLQIAMRSQDLNAASSKMSEQVHFLLAIPVLEPQEVGKFTHPNPVAGVIFVDSTSDSFFVSDDMLEEVVSAISSFVAGLERERVGTTERIFNMHLTGLGESLTPAKALPKAVSTALELVAGIEPPTTTRAFQLNFEYSDFIPVKTGWANAGG